MTDAEIRAAWLRLKDPFGSPARAILLAAGIGGVGTYAWTALRRDVGWPVLGAVLVVALVYGAGSLRARSTARGATEAEIRSRLLEDGVRALRRGGTTFVRALLWLGISGWSWAALAGAAPNPLGDDGTAAAFLASLGTVLGLGLLLDWRFTLPRIREDLRRLAAEDSG